MTQFHLAENFPWMKILIMGLLVLLAAVGIDYIPWSLDNSGNPVDDGLNGNIHENSVDVGSESGRNFNVIWNELYFYVGCDF